MPDDFLTCIGFQQIINPNDFKDATLLANRQARRNIIEDADGDEEMENADQEAAVETRPTKTVTNEVVVNVRAQHPAPCVIFLL